MESHNISNYVKSYKHGKQNIMNNESKMYVFGFEVMFDGNNEANLPNKTTN